MNFFGIGPLEVVFLVVIALIVLGPKDIVKAGRTIGRVLRQVVMSENWRAMQEVSREVRGLPTKLMRDAGLEDMGSILPDAATLRKEMGLEPPKGGPDTPNDDFSAWLNPPAGSSQTADDRPQTADDRPPTADDRPQTADGSQQSAVGGQPPAVGGQQSAVGGQQSAVSGQQSAVGGQPSALDSQPSPKQE